MKVIYKEQEYDIKEGGKVDDIFVDKKEFDEASKKLSEKDTAIEELTKERDKYRQEAEKITAEYKRAFEGKDPPKNGKDPIEQFNEAIKEAFK